MCACILNGTEAEHYRHAIPANVPTGSAAYLVIRPRGERAGDNPPRGAAPVRDLPDNRFELSEAEMAKWEKWQERENPARAAIIDTIAPSLRVVVREVWSAAECVAALKAKFTTSSNDHMRAAKAAVTSMRLRENCTQSDMRIHLNTFRDNIYLPEQVGVAWSDFDRCDSFLTSLPYDVAELLQLKWSIASLAALTQNSFEVLSDLYATVTMQYRLCWSATEGIAAAPGLAAPARKNAEVRGPIHANNKRTKENQRGRGKYRSKQQLPDQDVSDHPTCNHCEHRFHNKDNCHELAAGLPSRAERRQRVAAVRKAKEKKGEQDTQKPKPKRRSNEKTAAHVTLYDNDSDATDQEATAALFDSYQKGFEKRRRRHRGPRRRRATPVGHPSLHPHQPDNPSSHRQSQLPPPSSPTGGERPPLPPGLWRVCAPSQRQVPPHIPRTCTPAPLRAKPGWAQSRQPIWVPSGPSCPAARRPTSATSTSHETRASISCRPVASGTVDGPST